MTGDIQLPQPVIFQLQANMMNDPRPDPVSLANDEARALAQPQLHVEARGGIVDRRDLDALAVVCKAAHIDRAIFLTYAVSLLGADPNPMGKAAAYGRMYGELTGEAAQRTVRFWRVRRVAQAA